MSGLDVSQFTIDWNRCVHIDKTIDQDLIRELAPQILALRQASNDPITVAINTSGGSVQSMENLLGLITGENQDGTTCRAITVSVNNAYSSGALLLTYGSYSIALQNSRILFHDIRYGGLQDVTPEKALKAAKDLQNANERSSLKLADTVFKRLVWTYIDLRTKFEEYDKAYPEQFADFSSTVNSCTFNHPDGFAAEVHLASFATAMFANVSKSNECLIVNAFHRLKLWGVMTNIADAFPAYKPTRSRTHGVLDGAKHMYKEMRKRVSNDKDLNIWESVAPELKMFITLVTGQIAAKKQVENLNFTKILERGLDDYKLITSANDSRHHWSATRQLMGHMGRIVLGHPSDV